MADKDLYWRIQLLRDKVPICQPFRVENHDDVKLFVLRDWPIGISVVVYENKR